MSEAMGSEAPANLDDDSAHLGAAVVEGETKQSRYAHNRKVVGFVCYLDSGHASRNEMLMAATLDLTLLHRECANFIGRCRCLVS